MKSAKKRTGSGCCQSSFFVSPNFNPRSPCGERLTVMRWKRWMINISIHAPRVGSDLMDDEYRKKIVISIHAPRVGSDHSGRGLCDGHSGISIHAPCVGSDVGLRVIVLDRRDFNPRSPCGERHNAHRPLARGYTHFNPRSPCGERRDNSSPLRAQRRFQSTLPVWGATHRSCRSGEYAAISIHAPRVGSDSAGVQGGVGHDDFNPRSPCGERRPGMRHGNYILPFQSTLPVWGATAVELLHPHALWYFNPRSPGGERP